MGPVSTSARLATAGVILIGLGTSTLVYLAVTRPDPAPRSTITQPTSATDDEPTDDVVSPGATPTAIAAATFGAVLLDSSSATVAWRVTNDPGTSTASAAGACNGFRHPSSASMTGDGGATWTGIDLPYERVVQIRADGANALSVIGSDGDCSAGYASTTDGGSTWVKGPVPTDFWYVDATDFSAVHIGKAVSHPCPGQVLELSAPSATRAAVLCADNTIHATTNAGTSWTAATAPAHTVAVAADGDKWVVAVRGEQGCAGLTVGPLSATVTGGCVGIGASGPAALDVPDPKTVWAATPATSAVSVDAGVTWPY